MALGDVGHHSSHTMQGVAMAHGRHRPRSKKAGPDPHGRRSLVAHLLRRGPAHRWLRSGRPGHRAYRWARSTRSSRSGKGSTDPRTRLPERSGAEHCWGTPSCTGHTGCNAPGNSPRAREPGGRIRKGERLTAKCVSRPEQRNGRHACGHGSHHLPAGDVHLGRARRVFSGVRLRSGRN